ncbi:DUF551 domain-containing protein [Escherichia coli]|nr:DUF551 domain-containing protein [Escherichia coli]
MNTISKECIELFIKDPLKNGLTRSEQMEVARIALASLEAEPVAYQYRQWDAEYDEWGEWEDCGECAFERFIEEEKCQGAGVQTRKLYTAPPALVVPEEMYWQDTPVAAEGSYKASAYATGWNACLAAMLQSGNFRENTNSSTNSPGTPDSWISCSERMPNEEDVLVYCSDTKEQMVGFHKGKGLFQFFYMNGVEGVCEPSHWMPLPEPPQGVNRG